MNYRNPKKIVYYSERYQKYVVVPKDYPSDGATGAIDICSQAWWVHDVLKNTRTWEDGTPCSNRQASFVIYDILKIEGRWFRARTWFIATLLWGESTRRFKQLTEQNDEHRH